MTTGFKSLISRTFARIKERIRPTPAAERNASTKLLLRQAQERQALAERHEQNVEQASGHSRSHRTSWTANPAKCRCVRRTALWRPSICTFHARIRFCRVHRVYTCVDCGTVDRQPTFKNYRNRIVTGQTQ